VSAGLRQGRHHRPEEPVPHDDAHPDAAHLPHTDDATVPPPDDHWPADPPATLEQDLAVLAWLQCSPDLSSDTTGYLCDALLQWALLGHQWPDPAEPVGGPDCDHLEALVQLTERWMRRALAEPIGRRLELAGVGRALGTAIACQRDPQLLADSQWRELVHRQPWLAGSPTPYVLPDGRVL
jgi:hypothetical protein